jgi:hypothetical protein
MAFEFNTAVVLKSSVFWNITYSSALKASRRFGRLCRLHIQGRENKPKTKPASSDEYVKQEPSTKQWQVELLGPFLTPKAEAIYLHGN